MVRSKRKKKILVEYVWSKAIHLAAARKQRRSEARARVPIYFSRQHLQNLLLPGRPTS